MRLDDPGELKERQTCKIRELADSLVAVGFISLDEQADALGLSRSTTWTILQAKHKNYGLSAGIIKRVLRKPDLHPRIRSKIIEYVEAKAAGSYGHNDAQTHRFIRHMGTKALPGVHNTLFSLSKTRPEPTSDRKRPVKLKTFQSESVNRRDQ